MIETIRDVWPALVFIGVIVTIAGWVFYEGVRTAGEQEVAE